jgi:hypothetical protein
MLLKVLILENGSFVLVNKYSTRDNKVLCKRRGSGADAIKKFTPSLGIPYLGVWTPR